jgi:hypothetical protein
LRWNSDFGYSPDAGAEGYRLFSGRLGNDNSDQNIFTVGQYISESACAEPYGTRLSSEQTGVSAFSASSFPRQNEPRMLPFQSGEVTCRRRLGGLLKHYHRAAA